jgi:hypothetical protein
MSHFDDPKPFRGDLVFNNGTTLEGVEGELGRLVDPRQVQGARPVHAGRFACGWTRATLEVVGSRAKLQTAGGLRAQIRVISVVDREDEPGSHVEFEIIGSAIAGDLARP